MARRGNKRQIEVVLGVTGGIAAYKAAEIVRGLKREGAAVTVLMTAHAREFITPLTLRTLSGRPVIAETFARSVESSAAVADPRSDPEDVEHIGLARRCDLFLVAPATANVLARLASGIADDFLTTFYLALTCPVAIAPAMNSRMWEHPAVQENTARLRSRGVHLIGPEFGQLASAGEGEGMGRLAAPEQIVRRCLEIAGAGGPSSASHSGGALAGKKILVTAGPTREELDPVRFLSNPSTGKMGFAVAEAARDLGAEVVLVSGPTHLPDPAGVTTLRVTSAEQMRRAVMDQLGGAHVVVKAAAVSDFRPVLRSAVKVKKSAAPAELALQRTPDILEEIGRRKGKRYLVGFAAETDHLVANARKKLNAKKLDLVVANSVAADGAGGGAFGSDTSQVTVLSRGGRPQRWPEMTKREAAARLMALVASKIR